MYMSCSGCGNMFLLMLLWAGSRPSCIFSLMTFLSWSALAELTPLPRLYVSLMLMKMSAQAPDPPRDCDPGSADLGRLKPAPHLFSSLWS